MFSSRTHAAFAAIIAAAPGALTARAQTDPFYQSKRLTLLINFAAAAAVDALRRTLVVRPEVRKFVTDYIKNPPK